MALGGTVATDARRFAYFVILGLKSTFGTLHEPRFSSIMLEQPSDFSTGLDRAGTAWYRRLIGFCRNTQVQPFFGVEKRYVWLAAGFVLSFCLFESTYLGTGLAQWIAPIRQADNASYTLLAGVYMLTELYLFFLLILHILVGRWPYKVIGILLFAFAATCEYSYFGALGRFADPYDITTAFAVPSDVATDSIWAYFSFLWLIPTTALVFLGVMTRSGRRLGAKSFAFWLVATIVFYLQLFRFGPLLVGESLATNSFDAFSQTTLNYLVLNQIQGSHFVPRELIDNTQFRGHKPDNNIVVIFDESVRGDHLSVNGYNRETTPYLDAISRQKLLVNWGISSSASTSSKTSFDFFVIGANANVIEQTPLETRNKMPTIFQYAKAMNYKTYLLDGQMSRYWFGVPDDLNYIDQYRSVDVTKARLSLGEDAEQKGRFTKQLEIDPELARMASEIFSGSTGNFILIYKRGNHFPYEKNYSPNAVEWSPVYTLVNRKGFAAPPPEMVDALINSYDDAIKFNVDGFFKNLANDFSNLPNNTVIWYTSDHSDALKADGMAPHGGLTPDEATVPLLAFGLDPNSVDTSFKASHANLFTTLLDLMGVPDSARKYPYAISLLKAKGSDSKPRFFNMPDGKKIPFDQ